MEAPNQTVTGSASDFQRDLSRYWRNVRKQGEIALTAQGWIYKASFKSFLAALNMPAGVLSNDEASNGKLWFMRRMLVYMRELQGDHFGDKLTVGATGKLMGMTMAARVRWSFEAWRDGHAWNELVRLPGQGGNFDPRRDAPPGLAKARAAFLKALTRVAAGEPRGWTSSATLIAHIKKTDYQFLFERKRGLGYTGVHASPYFSANNNYGASFSVGRDDASGWDVIERAFIVHVLSGPLHWLGLLDLGYNAGEPLGENNLPSVYRLTETGAWLLGLGEPPVFVETGGRVVVQPNFNVLAMEPISDSVLVDLDQFADSLGGDRAVTYEITRESLYRGQKAGWGAERVVAFLEKQQSAPIPANVKRTLEEWESAHRKITFHRKRLAVQFADDDAEAQASLALAPFRPHALGERFLILRDGDVDKIGNTLRDAGWMPTVQPAEDGGLANSLRVEDDGAVVFAQSAPSVHALGRLAQFADADPHRISDASVRRAMNNALDVDQVLAMLAEMHNGPLSESLEKRIRTWAGFYGNASIKQVVLLELSNVDVMANLLADPVVGPYLTVIEGSSAPLALIDAGHIEEVRAVLRERGVTL